MKLPTQSGDLRITANREVLRIRTSLGHYMQMTPAQASRLSAALSLYVHHMTKEPAHD